jgi:hypothetical protein
VVLNLRGAKSGINQLASKANEKVDEYIKPIEEEGIIGDTLKKKKGLISMTGLGMKKRGRPKKILIDTATGAVKNKVETIGSGVAKKKILGLGIKSSQKT